MRLFQNSGLYPSYLPRLNQLARGSRRFDERRRIFLEDRFGAPHLLQPVLTGEPSAFFTNGDDEVLQRSWARENGLSDSVSLDSILLAQIEHHRTEVFYNIDPVRYPNDFIRRLPGCVRKTVAWRAAPSGNADLSGYGAVLGNFPSILESWRRKGCRAELFFPAVDPVMREYGGVERPIDVLFVGSYSRHHRSRGQILELVAGLADRFRVVFRLDASRLTQFAESFAGRLMPLRTHRRPAAIAALAEPAAFGRELYRLLGGSKIVLNGAIDMAGQDRGNMRCFEAMGCGALLLSDSGNYPAGMIANETILTYGTGEQCVQQIEKSLADWESAAALAEGGRRVIDDLYSKGQQWQSFNRLVENV